MKISARLREIAAACGACELLCDVGCDHGYTALAALQSGLAARALCMDVARGPLMHAVETFSQAGFMSPLPLTAEQCWPAQTAERNNHSQVENSSKVPQMGDTDIFPNGTASPRVSFLLSDGLRALALPDTMLRGAEITHRELFAEEIRRRMKNNSLRMRNTFQGTAKTASVLTDADWKTPDVLVLSGMGGRLICDILCLFPTNGSQEQNREELFRIAKDYLSGVRRLVLSPQSEPETVRHLLIDRLGFPITEERFLTDEGKDYLILTAEPGKACSRDGYRSEADYRYGVILLKRRDPAFLASLQRRADTIKGILPGLDPQGTRCQELESELRDIKRIETGTSVFACSSEPEGMNET